MASPSLAARAALCAAAVLAGAAPMAATARADSSGVRLAQAATPSVGPVVSILSPSYADQLKGKTQIMIGVQEGRHTPQAIELFVDGKAQTEGPLAIPSLPSAAFNWDTKLHQDGPHTLTVRVTDTQGFIGQAEVQVYINNNLVRDAAPPTLQWLKPPSGPLKGVVNLQVRAVDDFGVKFIIVSMNPAAFPDQKPPQRSWFLNRPPYVVSLDTRKVNDGLYILKALGYDALENEGAATPLSVGIANNGLQGINPIFPPSYNHQGGLLAANPKAPDSSTPSVAKPPVASAPPQVAAVPVVPNAVTGGDAGRIAKAPAPQTSAEPAAVTPRLSVWSEPRQGAVGAIASPSAMTSGGSVALFNPAPRATAPLATRSGRAKLPRIASAPQGGPNASAAPAPTKAVTATGSRLARAVPAEARPSSAVQPRLAPPQTNQRTMSPAVKLQAPAAPAAPAPQAAEATVVSRADSARLARAMPAETRTAPGAMPQASLRVPAMRPSKGNGMLSPMAVPGARRPAQAAARPSQPGAPQAQAPMPLPVFPRVTALPPLAPGETRPNAAITIAPSEAGPRIHRAGAGETLSHVAARYKLPVAVLAAANHCAPSKAFKLGEAVRLAQEINVTYEGKRVTGDVASMMVGSTGITPFRFLFQQAGGIVTWDAKNHRVIAADASHQVVLTIGSKAAMVNQEQVMMEMAAFLMSGRTMVPVRFFEKALRAQVEWNPATGSLYMAMAQ